VFGRESDRLRYAAALRRACRPGACVHLLAFQNFLPGGAWLTGLVTALQHVIVGVGTHGVSEAELHRAFNDGWTIEHLGEQALGKHRFRLARIRRL
jgi:hypothetical protein